MMNWFGRLIWRALVIFLGMAAPGLAQEIDPVKGEAVFRICLACHRIETPDNLVGPHLQGIVGRPAAAVENFKYSPAMVAKGQEGLIWTEPNLTAYLANPKHLVPGTKMAFPGLKKPEDIANLIAYLKSKSN